MRVPLAPDLDLDLDQNLAELKTATTPDDIVAMSQPEKSIGDEHARWILVGGVGAAILVALLATVIPMTFGLPYLQSGMIGAVAYTAGATLIPRTIAHVAARSFVEKFRIATLRLEPTTPNPDLEESAEWFRANGFASHGSWKTVGDDGVVYGSVGSWLFHQSDYAISAYLDRTQISLFSALSDGRTLTTTSVGAAPHPKMLIQGERNGDPAGLYELHGGGLRHLHAKGISAVEPRRGPLDHRLQLDRYEQEHLNTMSVAEGAVAIRRMISTPLGRIADEA